MSVLDLVSHSRSFLLHCLQATVAKPSTLKRACVMEDPPFLLIRIQSVILGVEIWLVKLPRQFCDIVTNQNSAVVTDRSMCLVSVSAATNAFITALCLVLYKALMELTAEAHSLDSICQ